MMSLFSISLFQKVRTVHDDDKDSFFCHDGEDVIKECFHAVHDNNHNDLKLMPARFRDFVLNAVSAAFKWPSTNIMGHGFTYLYE